MPTEYKASSTNRKNFTLTQEEKTLGDLHYTQWYSFQAEINLPDASHYDLKAKGFWDHKIELLQEDKLLMDFNMGWKGIVLNTYFDGIECRYLLKHVGMFSSQYGLYDTEGNQLLHVRPTFDWKKFNLDYTFQAEDQFELLNHKELLLLTIMHCINYQLSMMGGVVQ